MIIPLILLTFFAAHGAKPMLHTAYGEDRQHLSQPVGTYQIAGELDDCSQIFDQDPPSYQSLYPLATVRVNTAKHAENIRAELNKNYAAHDLPSIDLFLHILLTQHEVLINCFFGKEKVALFVVFDLFTQMIKAPSNCNKEVSQSMVHSLASPSSDPTGFLRSIQTLCRTKNITLTHVQTRALELTNANEQVMTGFYALMREAQIATQIYALSPQDAELVTFIDSFVDTLQTAMLSIQYRQPSKCTGCAFFHSVNHIILNYAQHIQSRAERATLIYWS